jgi:hypothetical protein
MALPDQIPVQQIPDEPGPAFHENPTHVPAYQPGEYLTPIESIVVQVREYNGCTTFLQVVSKR